MAEEQTLVETPVIETPPAEQKVETPAVPAVPDDLDSRIAKGISDGLAAQRKADTETAAAEAAKKAEAEQRANWKPHANPQVDAMDAFDLRQDLYEEALNLHPDMPQEARDELKKDIRSFKTVQELQAAKNAGLHIKLADAAAGEQIRKGKYTPKNMQVQAPSREPVGAGAVGAVQMSSIPESYRKNMEEEFRSMGLKMTDRDLADAWEMDQQRSR